MKLEECVKIARNKLELPSNLDISFDCGKEKGLRVIRKDNKVSITYSEKAELFRGLTLVKENINNLDFDILLNKHFEKDGYMIDCSRNGVVNIKSLKETILIQALMGQNRLLLYTEDTYKLDKYPWFGYLRGGYTMEEIKEVVEYGEDFGVRLIPCIQTLGHLGRPLHWEPMIPLRDGPTTLLIDDEKVYEFIEEMIKFSRECFKSNEIHIGMDESTEIGTGRYLNEHNNPDRVAMFCRHLDRVIGICKKYEFEPMIWSDMFFRLNTKDQEYYRDTPLPKETIDLIPEGVELVYWDYYHFEKSIYDRMNEYHKACNRPVVFAGGAWRWKGFAPSIRSSINMSIPAIESCVDNNIKFVFATAWGDNGNECSIFTTLPTLALFSTADYFACSDKSKVDSLLKAITGQSLEEFCLMDLPDMPGGKYLLPQYNPSKFLLYQDVLNGIFDKQVLPEYKENYKKYVSLLANEAKVSRDYGYIYDLLASLCDVMSNKVDLGVRLRDAYKANNKKELKKIIGDIPLLIKKIDKLNELSFVQWMKENKQFGFDVIDGRFGYLKNRLLYTSKIVNDYLKYKIEKIEELETEILPYNGHDYEVCWNWWMTNVTVQNL